jgi:hypothetical protein
LGLLKKIGFSLKPDNVRQRRGIRLSRGVRLARPGELKFGDAFARDGMAVAAAAPPEVVQGSLQRHFRFRETAGPEGAR